MIDINVIIIIKMIQQILSLEENIFYSLIIKFSENYAAWCFTSYKVKIMDHQIRYHYKYINKFSDTDLCGGNNKVMDIDNLLYFYNLFKLNSIYADIDPGFVKIYYDIINTPIKYYACITNLAVKDIKTFKLMSIVDRISFYGFNRKSENTNFTLWKYCCLYSHYDHARFKGIAMTHKTSKMEKVLVSNFGSYVIIDKRFHPRYYDALKY